MTTAVVDVPVPQEIYDRLQKVAVRLEKSVPVVLSETLLAVLPEDDKVPDDIQRELEQLALLDNQQLLQVSQEQMSDPAQSTMEQLLYLQSSRKLTNKEKNKLNKLRIEYGRIMLRKARAFALLADHGQPLPL